MKGAEPDARSYLAYGLRIRSSLPLWPGGGVGADGAADVVVRHRFGSPATGKLFHAAAARTAVTVPDVGEMTVWDGERIEVILSRGSSLDAAAVLVAGAGLGMALAQRGWFVLHGSAFRVGEAGVCVAGASGAGKSTILAEMHRRGHQMIADGMTPLRLLGERVVAEPGPPIMKVWPNTAHEMGWPPESLQLISPAHQKYFHRVDERLARRPVPLRTVFSASAGNPVVTTELQPRDALMELVKHAFLMEFSDAESAAVFLRQCAEIAPRLRVARLQRGSRIQDLSIVAAAIGS